MALDTRLALKVRPSGLRVLRNRDPGAVAPVNPSDPYAKRINASGWYVEGDIPPGVLNPDAAPRKIYGSTPGFDGNGNSISVLVERILTKQLRQPWPNQATPVNDTALDDYAYQDDVYPGIVNNSTVRSPKPVMNWGRVDRRIVGNSLRIEVLGFHRDARDGGQLACVEVIVSDGTTTLTAKTSTMTILSHPGDKYAVIGYAFTFDLTMLADNTAFTVNAKGYPKIGTVDAIRESNGTADSREFRPLRYFKNVAKAANPPIAVVSSSGVDASGVVSLTEATAAATPFLTLAGAANGLRLATGLTGGFTDGCEIRIADSDVATGSFAAVTFQSQYELTITKLSTVTQTQARFTLSANTNFRHTAVRFRDITINRSGTSQFSGGGCRYVLENVVYNNANATAAMMGTNTIGYLLGVTINGANGGSLLTESSGYTWGMVRGVDAGVIGTSLVVDPWLVVGCNFRSARPGEIAKPQSGSIIAFNYFAGVTSQWNTVGSNGDIDGAARVQNCVEGIATTLANMFAPSADGQTGNVTHLVDHHNTFVGDRALGRTNMLYNETNGTQRTHKLTSSVGQVTTQFNTKHDIFAGANLSLPDASQRTGGWAFMNGVGTVGLFSMYAAANPTSEHPEFPGLNASLGTSGTVRNDPLFIDNKAVVASPLTAGAGGGNYRLQAGSPLIGRVKKCVLPYDLDGNPRNINGTASGCFERLAA